MKISENWLRTWVNPPISSDELVSRLTMAGLEVDAVEPIGDQLTGVLVGQIIHAEQHPQAEKLKICTVDVGSKEKLPIICGAPNARQGIKVAVATIGSVLPGNFKIKKAKLRGVVSFGMLCSGKELELSDDHDGIIEVDEAAIIGQNFADFLALSDHCIDLDLTPNRGDCLSIKGVATEVGVLTQMPVQAVPIKTITATIGDGIEIKLKAPEANPRFVARVIKGINVQANTPDWIKARLLGADIRSIDPVVDVTNYVMLELGHPMHAFDAKSISGAIQTRYAEQGERLILLDEKTVDLNSDTLVVADDQKVLSIAGVMGGKFSAINAQTTDIVLEAAHWEPVAIAGKARSYGLHTDASHRFERGVDYNLCAQVVERASELLLDIVGGQAGPTIDKIDPIHFPKPVQIKLRRARVERLLGISLNDEQINDILTRLGMTLTAEEEGWQVQIPSNRFDLSLEADLIEELVRIYGYNKIPSRKPCAELSMTRRAENRLLKPQIGHLLAARGYQEAITYSFIDRVSQQRIDPSIEPLPLVNPISAELSVMRSSLWPGLLKAVEYNQKRQQDHVRFFETGLKFVPSEQGLNQIPVIAGAISGRRYNESWEANNQEVDFFDLKGDLEAIFKLTAAESQFDFVAAQRYALHPKQTAEITRNGKSCGFMGKIHPETQKAFDINQPVYLFELELKSVTKRKIPKFNNLSKFPSIRRDLAILVKESVTSSQIVDLIGQTAKNWLNNVIIFDIYRGKGVKAGFKSVALGILLQRNDRTFKEAEITRSIERVISTLTDKLGAVLRD